MKIYRSKKQAKRIMSTGVRIEKDIDGQNIQHS